LDTSSQVSTFCFLPLPLCRLYVHSYCKLQYIGTLNAAVCSGETPAEGVDLNHSFIHSFEKLSIDQFFCSRCQNFCQISFLRTTYRTHCKHANGTNYIPTLQPRHDTGIMCLVVGRPNIHTLYVLQFCVCTVHVLCVQTVN
jgi:hypothetical protein